MSRGTMAAPSGAPTSPPNSAWELMGAGPRNRSLTANSRGVVPGRLTRTALEGTPGRMRLLGIVAALVVAVFGIVGASSLWSSAGALARAGDNTEQVVRIQGIYADLVRADADATSAFLVGGLENPAQRTDYDASLARVTTGIAEAAQAQPADSQALGQLNTQVQLYAATVEQARVYNRQGQPVGAQYQSNASASLRSSILPIVTALVDANKARSDTEFTASSRGVVLVSVGFGALLVLVLLMVWLARRTHRYLNPSIFVGAIVVIAALALGVITLGGIGNQVQVVRTNDFARTVALAQARSAAFDAKANESLTLIARGSGGQYETAWKSQSANALTLLGSLDDNNRIRLQDEWNTYATAHKVIRDNDDKGQWDQAVQAALATGKDPNGKPTANAAFSAFDTDATTTLQRLQQSTQDGLSAPIGWVTALAWVLLALCVGAALLVLRGIGQRVEEYR